jgi:hypothetical protein
MLVAVVSFRFIITRQNGANQCVVSRPRLLAARERYLTINIKTSMITYLTYIKRRFLKRDAMRRWRLWLGFVT